MKRRRLLSLVGGAVFAVAAELSLARELKVFEEEFYDVNINVQVSSLGRWEMIQDGKVIASGLAGEPVVVPEKCSTFSVECVGGGGGGGSIFS